MEILQKGVFNPIAAKLITASLILLTVFGLARLLKHSLGTHVVNVDSRYRFRKLITFASYLAAALGIASLYSDRLGSFTVAFGVTGAGVAFALQEVIASAAGWVALSLGGIYSPGDRVQLAGIKGDVIDISILRTTLMEVGEWVSGDLYTGRIVRIANGFVFKSPVFNYSGDFPFLWDEITLPVKYGSDWKMARAMLHGIVNEVLKDYAQEVKASWKRLVQQYRIEDADVEPMITLRATDNWIEFNVRYVVDFRKRRWMKDHLFTRILEEIDKSENRVRLASATFEVVPGSTLDVNVKSTGDRL